MASASDGQPSSRTFLTTFDDIDLLDALCAVLAPDGVVLLESTCHTFRTALDDYWHRSLRNTGFADELAIPESERTPVARRVVVIETARRASFGTRLCSALHRLGLQERSSGGGTWT